MSHREVDTSPRTYDTSNWLTRNLRWSTRPKEKDETDARTPTCSVDGARPGQWIRTRPKVVVSERASEGKTMASDWCRSGLRQGLVQVRDTGALGFRQG